MSARDLIHQALADGVRLNLSDAGKLHYSGPEDSVGRWLPAIRENKPAIAEALSQAQGAPARHWVLHFADQNPREVLADNPEAIAAVPVPDQAVDHGEARYAVAADPGHEEPDDRHRCTDCGNLTYGGVCKVAAPGATVSAVKGYRPIAGVLVRCPGFVARGCA